MLNTLDSFAEQGRRVARAVNDNDGSRASFERDHFNRMLYLENEADRAKARLAYDEAYRDTRAIMTRPFETGDIGLPIKR